MEDENILENEANPIDEVMELVNNNTSEEELTKKEIELCERIDKIDDEKKKSRFERLCSFLDGCYSAFGLLFIFTILEGLVNLKGLGGYALPHLAILFTLCISNGVGVMRLFKKVDVSSGKSKDLKAKKESLKKAREIVRSYSEYRTETLEQERVTNDQLQESNKEYVEKTITKAPNYEQLTTPMIEDKPLTRTRKPR